MSTDTTNTVEVNVGVMNAARAAATYAHALARLKEKATRMLNEHKRNGIIDVDERGEDVWKALMIANMTEEDTGKELTREAAKRALRKLSLFKEGETKWNEWREEVEDL